MKGGGQASKQHRQTWYEVYHFATHVMGLSPKKFWKLDWAEYERRAWHYRYQLAYRHREPIRDLQAQLHNMFAERPIQPHELFALPTDRFNDGLRAAATKLSEQQQTWAHMKRLGLIH